MTSLLSHICIWKTMYVFIELTAYSSTSTTQFWNYLDMLIKCKISNYFLFIKKIIITWPLIWVNTLFQISPSDFNITLLFIYLYIYIYIYIHTHTHTYIHTYIHIHIHTHVLPFKSLESVKFYFKKLIHIFSKYVEWSKVTVQICIMLLKFIKESKLFCSCSCSVVAVLRNKSWSFH